MSDPLTEPVSNPKPDRPSLERLAAHIRSLPHRPAKNHPLTDPREREPLDPAPTYFDWANWTGDNATEHSCGTYGCVAGHAATLFPDLLYIDKCGVIRPVSNPSDYNDWCLMVFGLTDGESKAITLGYGVTGFDYQSDFIKPVDFLLSDGTPNQAADRILAVLELAERRHAALQTRPGDTE